MIPNLDGINKVFESKIRLGIMSVLMVNDFVDFVTLKSLLELTDGNLASHAHSLEEMGYIRCEKKFVGRKPNTSYSITEKGRNAFHTHIAALEAFLNNQPKI